MANTSRSGGEEPPLVFATTTPPHTQMMEQSFTLQAIIELKVSVASLEAKVDRLIGEVAKHGEKLDLVRHQISFVRGFLWAISVLVVTIVPLAIGAATLYLRWTGHG